MPEKKTSVSKIESKGSVKSGSNRSSASPDKTDKLDRATTPEIGGPIDYRKPINKRKTVIIASSVVAGLLVIFLVYFAILIYGYDSESSSVNAVAGIIPYPAMNVGGIFVSYSEYLFDMTSIEKSTQYYASINGQPAINFSSTSGAKQLDDLRAKVISQLKSDEVQRQLIIKNKITITDEEVKRRYNSIVKQAGSESKVKEVLKKVYGWNTEQLKTMLKFELQKAALQNKLTSDPALNAQAKSKADDVLKQINAGADFGTLAKKYSQDSSAAKGGDLGFLAKGQTPDKVLENTAFAQQPGQISAVIKTGYGYEIIKTVEFNADKSQVHIQQILIKPLDYQNYLATQIKSTNSTIYIQSCLTCKTKK